MRGPYACTFQGGGNRLPVPGHAPRRAPSRHAVPPSHQRRRAHDRSRGTPAPRGRSGRPDAADSRGDARHRALPATWAPGTAASDPRRSGGIAQRSVRRPRAACGTRRIAAGGVLPRCQDTGTAIVVGKKGELVLTGGGDEAAIARGVFDTYQTSNLRYSQMAPLDMYRRGEHRQQPPRADRDLRDRRRRVPVPLHGQGRRLGQQELPVPGDEGAAQPRQPHALLRREAAHARHVGVPAVPPRHRHRRHLRRSTR